MKTTVNWDGDNYVVTCPAWDKRIKDAPESHYALNGSWSLPPTDENVRFIRDKYNHKCYTQSAYESIEDHEFAPLEIIPFPRDFKFKNQPMEKQWDALDLAWTQAESALFMEMGTGKTFVTINIAAARNFNAQINRMLVICPTPVKPVWEIEIWKHYPDDTPIGYEIFVMGAGKNRQAIEFAEPGAHSDPLKIMIVGVEALSQGKANEIAAYFVAKGDTMVVIDESSRIKNAKANRSKRAWAIGAEAKYRMILTGTSVTQGIHDLYSQYRFLNWNIIGMKSFVGFRNKYCVMGGYDAREIVGYRNQDQLLDKISPHTVVITKEEMMDLPEKVYEPIYVEPGRQQDKALKELGDPFVMATEMDGHVLEVETILERMTRYQQIVGGHFPWKEGEETGIERFGQNPKMKAMMEIIDELPSDKKVIIWARFIPEILWIYECLQEAYPKQGTVLYYGGTPQEDRKQILEEFQENSIPRFFVSNPAMGGMGTTLTEAHYTIYYSNTFSLEDRMQSEDRNHRKGQINKVTYIDLIMNHQIDRSMVNALRNKKEMADYVKEELQMRQE